MKQQLVEGKDFYYTNEGKMVMTTQYPIHRKHCFGNSCKHCPYNYINVSPLNSSVLQQPKATIVEKKHNPFLQNAISKKRTLLMKKSTHSIPTIFPSGKKEKDFFLQVYDVVRLIPKGRVTSYGAIAAFLGTRLSARMVGWAMNAAHNVKPKVPAHRVVNRNGMLTGKHHFATPTQMEELLVKEKIEVKNDTIVDFEKLFWDPLKEIELFN